MSVDYETGDKSADYATGSYSKLQKVLASAHWNYSCPLHRATSPDMLQTRCSSTLCFNLEPHLVV